tara:strand:+ start:754 stop:1515 length:762 start_codon:yes stop_codon:yes gene_type:complete
MFESGKLKLQRADEHVRNLDEMFTAYLNLRPHRPVFKLKRNERNLWRVWVELLIDIPFPQEISLVLGDAIHNYRCVLDHLIWELIALDGGTPDRYTKFPIGKDQIDFEASARGVVTPRPDTNQFLVDLAAYRLGEGKLLYALNYLDNADKHTVITPVVHVSCLEDITIINLATRERITLDPIYANPATEGRVIYEAPEGFGIDSNYKIFPTPDIFFPEDNFLSGEPIVSALASISIKAEQTIKAFEWFVNSRV